MEVHMHLGEGYAGMLLDQWVTQKIVQYHATRYRETGW